MNISITTKSYTLNSTFCNDGLILHYFNEHTQGNKMKEHIGNGRNGIWFRFIIHNGNKNKEEDRSTIANMKCTLKESL